MILRALIVVGLLAIGGSAVAETAPHCPTLVAPVKTLSYQSRYSDNDQSRASIDPERQSQVKAALKPLDDFIDQMADHTEYLYVGPARHRSRAANCILAHLSIWAKADALANLETQTARLTIGPRLSALGLILWQTRPHLMDHRDRAAIEEWLARRLDEQRAFWPTAPTGARAGNLRAWAGLAGVALAVQTNDTALLNWAAASIEDVVCTAADDGHLPQEMRRDSLALHYQLYATAPLVTATVLLERMGEPASQYCNGAIHRIVGFSARNLIDGAEAREITGIEQNLFDGTAELMNFQLAWIEQYLVLAPSAFLDTVANDRRPLIFSKLGGNQTELWGHARAR